jgi:hypothetical protein
MTEKQKQIWDALVLLDSRALLAAIVNYYGAQFYSDEFAEFLVDEGILESSGEVGIEECIEGPGDDDYVIMDCGPLSYKTAVCVQSGWADKGKYKQFDSEAEAVKAIKEDMAVQGFRSNIWRQDDHGGMSRYDMS